VGVGADIESYCGKCGKTWHVVIAMVDGRVAQVECSRCGKRHRPRAESTAAPRVHRRTGEVSTPSARASKPLVDADMSAAPVPYTASGAYKPGQRVDHPAFGPGVVERVLATNKVQVFFATGSRVLAQRRD
jgi:hypothetical protein